MSQLCYFVDKLLTFSFILLLIVTHNVDNIIQSDYLCYKLASVNLILLIEYVTRSKFEV
jgi:uncharacterized membrane protein SirB2